LQPETYGKEDSPLPESFPPPGDLYRDSPPLFNSTHDAFDDEESPKKLPALPIPFSDDERDFLIQMLIDTFGYSYAGFPNGILLTELAAEILGTTKDYIESVMLLDPALAPSVNLVYTNDPFVPNNVVSEYQRTRQYHSED
jgi:hypothetical protein